MRNFFVLFISLGLVSTLAYAGGIMTNTNQSASYIRMPARDASLGIDAVYYNPAGLTGLSDGFHLSLNNQTISQTRKIENQLPILNNNNFEGSVSAPLFPSIYAVYKTGKIAFSFGFNPVGGGGGAEYEDGLPSFEAAIASAVFANPVVNGFRNDVYFNGTSIFYGGQAGISYKINDILSLYGGARYVTASNSYEGYLRNVEVRVGETWLPSGVPDIEVDAEQKGNAIAPLVGLSINPSDRFNIGIKYEFLTKLELENETVVDGTILLDGTGMFPDGEKVRSDMPAMLSAGAAYKLTPELNISGGMHYYFDKSADYGKALPNEDLIDNNFIEMALGLEYNLTSDLIVSAGYLRTQTGVNEDYHSDLSHSLSTNSVGLGGRYAINEMLAVNLGFMRTFYEEDSREVVPTIREIYNRDAMVFAIGLDFSF